MNKEELLEKLLDIIKLPIDEQYHDNYTRVCELKTLYSQIISGKDIDCLLKQFVRREDDVMFEQRKNLTKQITPAISESIMNTYNEVFRAKPIIEKLDFEGGDVEAKVIELQEALDTIYGQKNIYKYMQDRFLYLSFLDPNAFIYTTFDTFDPKKTKPQPYNAEISSVEAINYEYINDILQWLISRVPSVYIENKKPKDGFIYTVFGPEYAYVMTQVGIDYVADNGEEIVEIEITARRKNRFILDEYNHKSTVIPLIQVGYKRDTVTEGTSFVSPINPAMTFFEKLIKAVSEFDLTMCLHAFPQKTEYQDPCSFKPDGQCTDSGVDIARCHKCNKTGIRTIASAQDIRIFKLPRDKEEMIDLSNLTHYDYPPIELLEFQKTIINQWSDFAYKACFNAETFTAEQVAKLATGLNLDKQKVYNTLKPFSEKLSDFYKHVAIVSANYLDFYDPLVNHAYASDLKLKSITELLDELSKASTSGASGYILAGIQDDVILQMYVDKPVELQKYIAKQKFFPFNGKTKDEIQTIIMGGMVRRRDVILFNYFETIFSELENEYLANDVWFYDVEYKAQLAAIDKKIAEIDAELETAINLDVSEGVS